MAHTLAASAYFLTCCRPIHNSFGYLIEKPKLIDFYQYPFEYFLKYPQVGCKYGHGTFCDHNLNSYNVCTDQRAWSLDDSQRRQHFQDLIHCRIPHCGVEQTCKSGVYKDGTKEQDGKSKARESKSSDVQPVGKDKTNTKDKDEKKDKGVIDLHPPDSEIISSGCSSSEEDEPSAVKSKEHVPSVKSKKSEKIKPEPSVKSGKLGPDPSIKSKGSKKGKSEPSVKSGKHVPSTKSEESGKIGLMPSSSTVGSGMLGAEPEPSGKSERSVKIDPSVKTLTPKESENQELPPETSEESVEAVHDPSAKSIHSNKSGKQPSQKSIHSEKQASDPKDVVGLTDELIEKLDRNLRNLESTFDKFVKKNREFIQNLVECLDFEKQKHKSLEDDYSKLKQENEELKTQNDYLKMVNNKQLDLFKNELDRGISENKVIYKRKIHLMERQLLNDQNDLQTYKDIEKRYIEVVEQDNEKIKALNNKVDDLKNKEVQLVRNYLQLLKFLENVKDILSNADPKEIPQLRSLNTVTDSEGENEPDVKRVLKNALSDGISTLNVRDLSILHDAIEGINGGLCHQTDKCTKSPHADSSFPDFSTMSIHRLLVEQSFENLPKQFENYDTSSNLSIDQFPTKQKPENRRVSFGK